MFEQWLDALWTSNWFFLAVFTFLVAASFGAPIPEEVPVVLGGLWASAHPDMGPVRFLMLPVCIVGVVVSDGLLYGIGRRFGHRVLEFSFIKRIVTPEKRAKIEENYHKHGVKILLFARLLPGIRAPMFIMAGVIKLPWRTFLFADGIYAIPGVTLLFYLGFWFGRIILEGISQVKHIVLLVALCLIAAYLLYRFFRKPVSDGAPEDVPPIIQQMTSIIDEKLLHHRQHEGEGPPVPAPQPANGAQALRGPDEHDKPT